MAADELPDELRERIGRAVFETLRAIAPDAEQVTDDLCRELHAQGWPRSTLREARERIDHHGGGAGAYSRKMRQFLWVEVGSFPRR